MKKEFNTSICKLKVSTAKIEENESDQMNCTEKAQWLNLIKDLQRFREIRTSNYSDIGWTSSKADGNFRKDLLVNSCDSLILFKSW